MRNIRSITFAALLVSAASCWALPSLQQVESAVKAGDYASAETMTREVVAAKPNLPKAHYILAELMAHNKELSQAKEELDKAKDLDPAIHFTAPDKFNSFQRELDESIAKSVATPVISSGNEPFSTLLNYLPMALGFMIIIYAISWIFRRQDPAPNPLASGSYVPRPSPSSSVGGGYATYPQTIVQPSTGSSALGTGLAVAGGVVAGELIADELRSHNRHESSYRRRDDDVASNTSYNPSNPSNDITQRPIDFGNGDDWDNTAKSSNTIDLGGSSGGANVLDDDGWDA